MPPMMLPLALSLAPIPVADAAATCPTVEQWVEQGAVQGAARVLNKAEVARLRLYFLAMGRVMAFDSATLFETPTGGLILLQTGVHVCAHYRSGANWERVRAFILENTV